MVEPSSNCTTAVAPCHAMRSAVRPARIFVSFLFADIATALS
jgi:hypothetical protein